MNRSPENGGEQQPPGAVYSYRDVRFHVCYNSEHTEWISTTSPHSRNRKARQLLARWPKIVLLPTGRQRSDSPSRRGIRPEALRTASENLWNSPRHSFQWFAMDSVAIPITATTATPLTPQRNTRPQNEESELSACLPHRYRRSGWLRKDGSRRSS